MIDYHVERLINGFEEQLCFIPIYGPVAFILWVLNGNAHYHHKDNIPDQEENYNWYRLTGLVGSGLYGLAPSQSSLSLWQKKRALHQSYFWLVDSHVWGISDRP